MNSTLVWLREDLRVADNPALFHAAQLGAPITVVFILDDVSEGIRPLGGASRWWLHHSLQVLRTSLAELGINLVLRRGASRQIVRELVAETGATSVFWNRRYGSVERDIDAELKTELRKSGLNVESFQASLLYEPWTVQTGAGKPYSVFTPFYRACLAKLKPRAAYPQPEPRNPGGDAVQTGIASDELESWNLLPEAPDWAAGFRAKWRPGELGASQRLALFLEQNAETYPQGRDFPARAGTSELSAHLRWGEISPFQVWHAVDRASADNPRLAEGSTSFIRELLWREFSYNLLYFWPHLATDNFNPKFNAFPWRNTNDAALTAWKTGNTGIPLVDAGMRELWHTGYMHNRVRMIVASFLTKNLMIDWREGEQWFWDTLVDADPANNPASWQWVAGCGADAAPYFRIFNPELQAQKFDAEQQYIARWVPEAVSMELAFERGYAPIVDLKLSRAEALAAYQRLGEINSSA